MAQAAERRLSYDKNLLREAEAMQEQFQLRPNRSGFASSSQARLAHSPQPPTSIQFSEKATPSGNELPFWRTTKGKVLVAVVVLVIIGAVVGAAVGTTVHKSQPVTNNTISTSPASTATVVTGNGVGAGAVPTAVSLLPNPTAIVRDISPAGGRQHPPGSDSTTRMT